MFNLTHTLLLLCYAIQLNLIELSFYVFVYYYLLSFLIATVQYLWLYYTYQNILLID